MERYRLCSPVDGGYAFWAITDVRRQFAVVTIYRGVPHAEEIARALYERLN